MTNIPFLITASKSGSKALIKITGTIGLDVQAELFRSQVEALASEGLQDAHIYINSPGGSVFDTSEIVNIIRQSFPGKITGEGGTLVASAATYIAMFCDSFTMPENGIFMIHKPSGVIQGDTKDIQSYLLLLQKIEAQYFEKYKSKAKAVETLEAMWNNGDWWMTAQEAQSNGFITGITGKVATDSQTEALIVACGCPDGKFPSRKDNIALVMEALDLPKDSSIDQVLQSISSLHRDIPTNKVNEAIKNGYVDSMEKGYLLSMSKSNPGAFDSFIQRKKATYERELSKKIETTVNDAIVEKRIVATAKNYWINILKSDFDNACSALQAIEPLQKIKYTPSGGSGGESRTNWTLDDYRKKDPKALQKDPSLYSKLLDNELKNK